MLKRASIRAVVSVVALLLAPSGVPRGAVLDAGFLPPNDLRIPIDSLLDKGLSRKQYDAVLDHVQDLYGPIFAARGRRLVIQRFWEAATVNAWAFRRGDDDIVVMFGGLARHASITQDGLALVVCHELGHHIGGAPKYDGDNWASNEGQADYFANLKCLRRVFAAPGADAFTAPRGDGAEARAACAQAHVRKEDQNLCVRSLMAGLSVTNLFRDLRGEVALPHFNTPDRTIVDQTYDYHPGTQCRLDTYFQGSLCARSLLDEVSPTDPAVGTCTRSEGFPAGFRPRCWYLPPIGERSPVEMDAARASAPMGDSPSLGLLKAPAVWRGL